MFKSNRSKCVAIGLAVLILIIFACFIAVYSFQKYQSDHTKQRDSVTQNKAETVEQYFDICIKRDESITNISKCFSQSIDANRNAQRAQHDLQAQQEMAEWAYALYLLTIAGLIISSAGLTFLFWSLRQTRVAIRSALIGNRLSLKAIKQEQSNAQKGLRAYVGIDSVKILYTLNNIATTRIILKNTGQTPARDVLAVIHNDILDLPAEESSFPIVFTMAKSKTSMERDGFSKLEIPTIDKVDEFSMSKMQVDRTAIFVWGEVRYKDVFGDEWFTRYRFQSDPLGHKEHKTDGIVCAAGNEAT